MIEHLLNRTLEVWDPTTVTDAGGGQGVTWTLVGTEPARISRPSESQRVLAERERAWVTHDVYLRPGADVTRGRELREPGLTLTVLAVVAPSEALYTKAVCESVQPPG